MINFFTKRKKHTHQLTVGLRTQLCKECHDLQRRLCLVDGKPALFHRWIDEDKALLHINVLTRPEEQQTLNRTFRNEGIVPECCSVEVVRNTYALVEYPDGSVGKVKPEMIQFLDKEGET